MDELITTRMAMGGFQVYRFRNAMAGDWAGLVPSSRAYYEAMAAAILRHAPALSGRALASRVLHEATPEYVGGEAQLWRTTPAGHQTLLTDIADAMAAAGACHAR